MRYLLLVLLSFPLSALAYITIAEPIPYTEITLNDVVAEQIWYGELTGSPHTFFFSLGATTTFHSQLMLTPDTPENASTIVTKSKVRGVTEIDRRTGKEVAWEPYYDTAMNYTFSAAPPLGAILVPGSYRLEVSMPDNLGKYRLQIGTEAVNRSYGETLSDIRTGYVFIGQPWGIWRTPEYYLPATIILLLIGYWLYRRYA